MRQRPSTFRAQSDPLVLRRHGCLVFIPFKATTWFTKISLIYCFSRLSRRKLFAGTYDRLHRKALPWWQDIALLVAFTLAAMSVWSSWLSQGCTRFLALVPAAYVLIDLTVYYSRVLWFDDLSPAIAGGSPDVWSHRRLLFHSLTGFFASVLIFPGFYHLCSVHWASSYSELLARSYRTSIGLELSKHFTVVDLLQIALTVYFLVVVIATVAAAAYKRREIAGR